jgi:hypothetical protein
MAIQKPSFPDENEQEAEKDLALSEEPRAPARGFFQRKSPICLAVIHVQALIALHPGSFERGILAFSRNLLAMPMVADLER